MTSYPFATTADRMLGIAFIRTSNAVKATLFSQKRPTDKPDEEPSKLETFTLTRDFSCQFSVLDQGAGMLLVETNGWSKIPYRSPVAFLLGSIQPTASDGLKIPYYEVSETDPKAVDRSIWFQYHHTGGGASGDRPYITWDDELEGQGKMVFTKDSPGVILGLRMNKGNVGELYIGKTSPWGETTVST